ncbi:MAG: hemerythrin domain-containing protein [Nitrososphaerales archaeon]|nr:hemerythrin domain-containing protein [Nitrososphaerales archaeon]
MELEDLVAVLVAEHTEMKAGLENLRSALEARDYAAAKAILAGLKAVFTRHIADEEAQVLKVLIEAYGVKGAEDAIMVFRQHRPMYTLMEAIERFAALSPAELESKEEELNGLFGQHTKAEEERIFPWALSTHRSGTQH